jgi:hypothetical protein
MDLKERMRNFHARRQAEFDQQRRDHRQRVIRDEAMQKAAGAVLEGRTPSLKHIGRDVTVLHVVDPGEQQEFRDGKREKAPAARAKLFALRDDPIGRMHRRNYLGEGADGLTRLQAARHLQSLYELAEIGSVKGIDPAKDKVDGGGVIEPDTDVRMAAQRQIQRIERRLRDDDTDLIRLVLWHRTDISAIVDNAGYGLNRDCRRTEITYLVRRLRGALDRTAIVFGYKAPPGRRVGVGRVRDEFDEAAKYANNPRLYDAIVKARREGGPRKGETYRAARRNAAPRKK